MRHQRWPQALLCCPYFLLVLRNKTPIKNPDKQTIHLHTHGARIHKHTRTHTHTHMHTHTHTHTHTRTHTHTHTHTHTTHNTKILWKLWACTCAKCTTNIGARAHETRLPLREHRYREAEGTRKAVRGTCRGLERSGNAPVPHTVTIWTHDSHNAANNLARVVNLQPRINNQPMR